MRKVSQSTAVKFYQWSRFEDKKEKSTYTVGNTTVVDEDGEISYYLHGNLIARYLKGEKRLIVGSAGWKTVTTKERLNAVLYYMNAGEIVQRKGQWYINGVEWDGQPIAFNLSYSWY